jgi:hypothetical protein
MHVHRTSRYEANIDLSNAVATITVVDDPSARAVVGLSMAVDALGELVRDVGRVLATETRVTESGELCITFTVESEVWASKTVEATFSDDAIALRATVTGTGRRVREVRALISADGEGGDVGAAHLYSPRFDWFEAQVRSAPDVRERLGAQQWLSPPPLVYVLEAEASALWIAACGASDELDFVSMDWDGSSGGVVTLPYEGHRTVHGTFSTPLIAVGVAREGGNHAVRSAVEWQRDRGILPRVQDKVIPSWWSEPIFCGWGQMRADYRADHQGHENGNFINVTSYCTELRYRNYMADLDARGVDPGTIVIDMGWAAQAALARPHPHRWSNLRGFVDEQHARGRRVLLWFSPSVAEGLPPEACMTLQGEILAPDPTSPVYRDILREQIRIMLSGEEGCLNADGFKIDFTQCYPSEDGRFVSAVQNFAGIINEEDHRYLYPRLSEGREELIQTHGERWGIALIRDHIGQIYAAMKEVKPDSALMTHTANPAFADVVDILRLNDLDGDCGDVLAVMTNRAELARISCDSWLIDTDDDLMIDKERWLAYARLQPKIGIPDSYYVSAIAHSGEAITADDWREVRAIWAEYRSKKAT